MRKMNSDIPEHEKVLVRLKWLSTKAGKEWKMREEQKEKEREAYLASDEYQKDMEEMAKPRVADDFPLEDDEEEDDEDTGDDPDYVAHREEYKEMIAEMFASYFKEKEERVKKIEPMD